jgi:hypothetical protein
MIKFYSADDGGADYRAFPTLKSMRWMLPTGRVHRRSGIEIYRPTTLKGHLVKGLITSGLMRGEAAPAAAKSLEQMRSAIGKVLGLPNLEVGLALGTQGAYRKNTLRIMAPDGTPVAYAKLADLELSKRQVAAEYANLIHLSRFTDLRGHVPEALFFGELANHLALLTTSGVDQRGPRKFSRGHEQFLRTLFSASRIEKPLSESAFWKEICQNMEWLATGAPQPSLDRLARAVEHVQSEFGAAPIALSTVHRDFAPWNTCGSSDKLFVFDWEMSTPEGPPLHDLIHFHAVQSVVKGRNDNLDVAQMRTLATKILGDANSKLINLHVFYILYLIDMAVFYLKALLEAPNVSGTTELTWIERQIDMNLKN